MLDYQDVPLVVESTEMKHLVMEWLEILNLHQLIVDEEMES